MKGGQDKKARVRKYRKENVLSGERDESGKAG